MLIDLNSFRETRATQQPQSLKILLVGESCIDKYHYGRVERISPEAPVPVVVTTRMETRSGMAANVLVNLKTLGCDVDFFEGEKSCVRTRIIDERSGQHIVRIDEDNFSTPLDFQYMDMSRYDAVVISDYDKGVVGNSTILSIVQNFNKPIFVDTKKKDHSIFENCLVKVNQPEYEKVINPTPYTIVTKGKDGADYMGENFPAFPVNVADVTGAGDTFLAALAYKFLVTENIKSAIEFANKASSVTVQHIGVYAPTLEEIEGR